MVVVAVGAGRCSSRAVVPNVGFDFQKGNLAGLFELTERRESNKTRVRKFLFLIDFN